MKTKLHMRSIIACENIAFSPAESINLAETYKGTSAKLWFIYRLNLKDNHRSLGANALIAAVWSTS